MHSKNPGLELFRAYLGLTQAYERFSNSFFNECSHHE
jgi:hypothetical protein